MIDNRDEWETPKELWDELNDQYGFFIDCCANKENAKTNRYFEDFMVKDQKRSKI